MPVDDREGSNDSGCGCSAIDLAAKDSSRCKGLTSVL